MSDDAVLIKRAEDALEAARKKLIVGGKSANGFENLYAAAYATLARLNSLRYRPLRGKYRAR